MAKRQAVIIERGDKGRLFGRTTIDDDLIVVEAKTIQYVGEKVKIAAAVYHSKTIEPYYLYDLTAIFHVLSYLNITAIAKSAGINPSLMRQYASGSKFPSAKRVSEIERIINELGREMEKVKIVSGKKIK